MNIASKLTRKIFVFFATSTLLLAASGCDMGTYNGRFQERLSTSGNAFQVADEDAEGE